MISINSDLYASITFIGWQLQFILRKIWQGLYVSKCLQRRQLHHGLFYKLRCDYGRWQICPINKHILQLLKASYQITQNKIMLKTKLITSNRKSYQVSKFSIFILYIGWSYGSSEGWKNLYPCISICLKLIRHGTWVVLRNVWGRKVLWSSSCRLITFREKVGCRCTQTFA